MDFATYQATLKRNGLTELPSKQYTDLERRVIENDRKRTEGAASEQKKREHEILNALYAHYGPSGTKLHGEIFRILFHRRFNVFPDTGVSQKHVDERMWERVAEVCTRICYPPGTFEEHLKPAMGKRKTIHDYTGKDDSGRPETFAEFFEKRADKGYDALLKSARREEKKTVHFEESAERRAVTGGISEGEAMSQAAIPEGCSQRQRERAAANGTLAEDCPEYVNISDKLEDHNSIFSGYHLPAALAAQLQQVRATLTSAYPQLGFALFKVGETSAAEISRIVKGDGNSWKMFEERGSRDSVYVKPDGRIGLRKTPKDRATITAIKNAALDEMRRLVADYVSRTQESLAERVATLADEYAVELAQSGWTPKDLSDPDVLLAEMRRLLGWRAKAERPKRSRVRTGVASAERSSTPAPDEGAPPKISSLKNERNDSEPLELAVTNA
jgi:hypothetical protein